MEEDREGRDCENHPQISAGDLADEPETGPFEGGDHHHKHDANEAGHGNHLDQIWSNHDEAEQENRRGYSREPSPPPRIDVDHALPNHRTTAHPSEKPCDDVGRTLAQALTGGRTTGLGEFVDQGEGHQ